MHTVPNSNRGGPLTQAAKGSIGLLVALAACAVPSGQVKGPGELSPGPPSGATARAARRIALVIGIDEFESTDLRTLRFAAQDATALGEKLSKEGFDEVLVVTEPHATTRLAVQQTLDDVLSDTGRNDALLVYVSTHGTLAKRPGKGWRRYLATRDTNMKEVLSTGLSVEALVTQLEDAPASRVALILAACYSGTGKSRLSPEATVALETSKGPNPWLSVSESISIVSASGMTEPARETEALGNGHDIYTFYLLQAMSEGDLDSDGAVTLDEAHHFATRHTLAYTNGAQKPTAESRVLGRAPIVLAGAPERLGSPVLHSYDPSMSHIELNIDGEPYKGPLPGTVVVSEGVHHLRLTERGTGELLYEGELKAKPGLRQDIMEFLGDERPWRIRTSASVFVPLGNDGLAAAGPGFAMRVSRRIDRSGLFRVSTTLSGNFGARERATDSFETIMLRLAPGLSVNFRPAEFWLLQLELRAGAAFATRQVTQPSDQPRQSFLGWNYDLGLLVERSVWRALTAHVQAHSGLLHAKIEDGQIHPYVDVSAGLGWKF